MITFQKFMNRKTAFTNLLRFSQMIDIIEDIVFQTNLHATQNDLNTIFNVSMSNKKVHWDPNIYGYRQPSGNK